VASFFWATLYCSLVCTKQVPNWGQEPDKTFDIRLTDAMGVHDIYLTRLVFDPSLQSGPASPESARNSLLSRRAAAHAPAGYRSLLTGVILVAGGLVAVTLLSLAVAHLCRSVTVTSKPASVVSEKDAVIYDVSRAQVVTATTGASLAMRLTVLRQS